MKTKNLIGQKFNRLTVIADGGYYQEPKGQRRKRWLCVCQCGNETLVVGKHLKSGNTKSCGCLQRESVIKKNYKHGLSRHKIYNLWVIMNRRCYDLGQTQSHGYIEKEITVCKEWRNDFHLFYRWAITNGWKSGLQIDRIDNDGNYEPSNCRFVTSRQNNLNRRLLKASNSSGYEGVHMDSESGKWRALIMVKGKTFHLGRFARKIDAAKARNIFIIENNLRHEYKMQNVFGMAFRFLTCNL